MKYALTVTPGVLKISWLCLWKTTFVPLNCKYSNNFFETGRSAANRIVIGLTLTISQLLLSLTWNHPVFLGNLLWDFELTGAEEKMLYICHSLFFLSPLCLDRESCFLPGCPLSITLISPFNYCLYEPPSVSLSPLGIWEMEWNGRGWWLTRGSSVRIQGGQGLFKSGVFASPNLIQHHALPAWHNDQRKRG